MRHYLSEGTDECDKRIRKDAETNARKLCTTCLYSRPWFSFWETPVRKTREDPHLYGAYPEVASGEGGIQPARNRTRRRAAAGSGETAGGFRGSGPAGFSGPAFSRPPPQAGSSSQPDLRPPSALGNVSAVTSPAVQGGDPRWRPQFPARVGWGLP